MEKKHAVEYLREIKLLTVTCACLVSVQSLSIKMSDGLVEKTVAQLAVRA